MDNHEVIMQSKFYICSPEIFQSAEILKSNHTKSSSYHRFIKTFFQMYYISYTIIINWTSLLSQTQFIHFRTLLKNLINGIFVESNNALS